MACFAVLSYCYVMLSHDTAVELAAVEHLSAGEGTFQS